MKRFFLLQELLILSCLLTDDSSQGPFELTCSTWKGIRQQDELVEPSMRSAGSKHERIISLTLQHDCNTMDLLSCLISLSYHRHTTALMLFTLGSNGLFRPKTLLEQTTKQRNEWSGGAATILVRLPGTYLIEEGVEIDGPRARRQIDSLRTRRWEITRCDKWQQTSASRDAATQRTPTR